MTRLERYDSIDDIDTHDEDLVIICGREEFFGTPVEEIVDDICDRINGDQLTLEEFPNGKRRVEKHAWLVQHSVWFIHYEEFLEGETAERLDTYFDTEMLTIPKETEVFVCVDDGDDDMCRSLKDDYEDQITIATREDVLIRLAAAHLNHANPARGKAGKQAIKEWNNAVCTLLNQFGTMGHG